MAGMTQLSPVTDTNKNKKSKTTNVTFFIQEMRRNLNIQPSREFLNN